MTMFDRINQLSKKLGISLREVNDRAGLGTNAIYRWKNQKPSSDKVNKVANVLGVTADYLINGDPGSELFDRVDKTARQKGISLRELNLRAGLGVNSIYKWKTTTPSSDKVEKVAHVLGVTTDYLLNGREKATPKIADLADDETIFTYQGKPLTDEDKELIRRLMKGKG